MIQLKKEFTKKGFIFKQIFKDSYLAVYQTDYPSFEVFKVVIHKADKYHNDEYELYLYDEAFGLFAWSCSNPSHLAKVLNDKFKEHPLAKQMEKYIVGTYKQNGISRPKFEISNEQMMEEFKNAQI